MSFIKFKVLFLLSLLVFVILGVTFFASHEEDYVSAPKTGLEGQSYIIENFKFILKEESDGVIFIINHLKITHAEYPKSGFRYDLEGSIKSNKFKIFRLAIKADFLGKNNVLLGTELFWFLNVNVVDSSYLFDDAYVLHPRAFSSLLADSQDKFYLNKRNKAQKIFKVYFNIHCLDRYDPAKLD